MPLAAIRPSDTAPTLEQLYVGPLEGLTPPAIGTLPGAGSVSGPALRDPATLEALLERFATGYQGGDRRAVASLWSKWHFAAVIAASLAANLLLERELPLDDDSLAITLSPEGRTARLHLAHDGTPLATQDPGQRFAALLDGHLAPLITRLAALSGASPRVFWSNAGNGFEHFAQAISRHPLAQPHCAEPALRLLQQRHYPDGRRNPLYQPVRYIDAASERQRVRKLCCLRYLLPELAYCGNCPLEACDRRVRR